MIFETIDKLRRAPHPVRERIVALVTIVSVALVTVIWFAFFFSSFFSSSDAAPVSAPIEEKGEFIEPPFSN